MCYEIFPSLSYKQLLFPYISSVNNGCYKTVFTILKFIVKVHYGYIKILEIWKGTQFLALLDFHICTTSIIPMWFSSLVFCHFLKLFLLK